MKFEFRKPTEKDAVEIAKRLAKSNRLELLAAIGGNAEEDIKRGIKYSDDVGCLYINGVPEAVYGVRKDSVVSRTGQAWLLLTRECASHKVFVGKYSKIALAQILTRYERVYNWVNAGNDEIIKWLKWMGAEISGPYPHGVFDLPHYYFEFRRDK